MEGDLEEFEEGPLSREGVSREEDRAIDQAMENAEDFALPLPDASMMIIWNPELASNQRDQLEKLRQRLQFELGLREVVNVTESTVIPGSMVQIRINLGKLSDSKVAPFVFRVAKAMVEGGLSGVG